MRLIGIGWIGLAVLGCLGMGSYEPRDGDIIFQTSRSAQSRAIQQATHSPWSHMGIVYVDDGQPFVYEAVGPVRLTPLDRWIERGEEGRFAVRRLREAGRILTPQGRARMRQVAEGFRGRPYDSWFEWSDDRLYCSELVWKIYQRGLGVELGALQRMAEFDFSDSLVRVMAEERWGGDVPVDEPVISPDAVFRSDRLVTVYRK